MPALEAAGHSVQAMTRHPDTYSGAGTPVYGDVHEAESLSAALAGCDAAYYLVHSLGDADFTRRDADAAREFARAAADAGLGRIIYLGGLGDDDDDLSEHLRSRREVEHLLGSAGVPVTTLRAGIIIGHGGISWEITRQLVEHLPAMITPRWVRTRTQPIAVGDVVRYLVGVLDARGGRPHVRHRRPRRAGLRGHAAPGRRDRGPPPAGVPGAAARPRGCPRAGCRWSPTSTCRPAARSSTR